MKVTLDYSCDREVFLIRASYDILSEISYVISEYSNIENDYLVVSNKYIQTLRKDLAFLKRKKVEIFTTSAFKLFVKRYDTSIVMMIGPIRSKINLKHKNVLPLEAIDKKCAYFFKPALNQKAYKDGRWDGYVRLFNKKTLEFPTGLLPIIEDELKKANLSMTKRMLYDEKPKKEFNWIPKNLFTLSEDQEEAISICNEKGRGTIKAATGFGKTSALARFVIANKGVPSLFIANKKVLLDDALDDFLGGIDNLDISDCGKIKDGIFGDFKVTKDSQDFTLCLENKKIIVATIQSLKARLDDIRTAPELRRWLRDKCKLVMVDESQAIGSRIWDEVLDSIHAPYRYALSATPKRTDGAGLKIFAATGPVIFDTTGEEQIKKGRLCELDIQYHCYDHKLYNDSDSSLQYQDMYRACIVENNERNALIVDKVMGMTKEERQVLLLIQFIDHGEILKEALVSAGLNEEDVIFIHGTTKDKDRNNAIDNFRKGKFKVLIGSTIADAGLNIKTISGVFMAGAGNSEISLIQRIGRGARECDYQNEIGYTPTFIRENNGKKIAKIMDILDLNVCFFNKQSNNRIKNAKLEFGEERVAIKGYSNQMKKSKSKKIESFNTDEDMLDSFDSLNNQIEMLDNFDTNLNDFINLFNN